MMKRVVLICLVLTIIGCGETEELRIPFRQVYLELHLDGTDMELNSVNHSKVYAKRVNEFDRIGFGGIIVYHSPFDTGYGSLVAYDRSCPYEAESSTVVVVEEQGDLYAVCSKCKSKYELTSGYPTQESISKYRLQQYRVQGTGSKLFVTN
ncbi:hypothetical protein LJC54_08910 [Parabacteroides sp. OttesenSCG-928-J18]|nr:hypothetical protein [Parabacteroides sp. OttesenSCG-928-J18]